MVDRNTYITQVNDATSIRGEICVETIKILNQPLAIINILGIIIILSLVGLLLLVVLVG